MPPRAGTCSRRAQAATASTRRAARWVRCAQRRITKTPTPDGTEMGERLRLVRSATIPPARDLQVARTENVSWLRADGSPSRVNDTQWRVSRYDLPVTVAGPRRTCTGFRESRFACNDHS